VLRCLLALRGGRRIQPRDRPGLPRRHPCPWRLPGANGAVRRLPWPRTVHRCLAAPPRSDGESGMSDEPKVTAKRFIAGAVCPACSATDIIKMWDVDEVPHRECVVCGYADTLNAQGQSVPSELGTRVNQVKPKATAAQVQTVQFFPKPKLKKT